MTDKVAVTHLGGLRAKYGARAGEVEQALELLAAADARRGLRTEIVSLDAVPDPRDEAAMKAAVDGVVAALDPGALLLVGASDVVPHQTLDSPLHDPTQPYRYPDVEVPSDLPYAHAAPAGRSVAPFLVPQRDLGRLPGHLGSDDPAPLVAAILTAARGRAAPREDFLHCFAVSAGSFSGETRASLAEIFGEGQRFYLPREAALEETRAAEASLAPGWFSVRGDDSVGPEGSRPLFLSKPPTSPTVDGKRSRLGRRAHFINAHGDHETPYVRHGPDFGWEIILTSDDLEGQVRPGTVVAGLFCYAAELYDPRRAGRPGICNAYLSGGAAGFFGATNYTFGSPAGGRYASLLARLFFQGVLDGLPLGEAVRAARLQYLVQFGAALDPMDLKVLAQMTLLGDPTASPVRREGRADVRARPGAPGAGSGPGGARMAGVSTHGGGGRAARRERERRSASRRRSARWGASLELELRVPVAQPGLRPAPATMDRIEPLLRAAGLDDLAVHSWLAVPRDRPGLEDTDRGVPMMHLVSGTPTHGPAWRTRTATVFAVHLASDGRVAVYEADRH